MSEFVDYLHEVFEPFGAIRARRMFGGYGIYHDELMFALVADDVLYLKADAETADLFTQRGLAAFEYVRGRKRITLAYYQAPEEMFEEPGAAGIWAGRAYEAALRGRRAGRKTGKPA